MSLIDSLKPKFWDHFDSAFTAYKHMFNFRQIWKQAVIVIRLFAVIPLAIIHAKAGLIEDLFTIKNEYQDDLKLLAQVRTIQQVIDRCENGKGTYFTAKPFKIELLIEKIQSSLAHVPTGKKAHERQR